MTVLRPMCLFLLTESSHQPTDSLGHADQCKSEVKRYQGKCKVWLHHLYNSLQFST